MKRIAAYGVFTLMLLGHGAICGAAGPGFQAGLWEMNMETRMEGLPMAVPPSIVTVKQCLTPEEQVPKDPNSSNCTFGKMKQSGNKVSWEYQCNQDGTRATGKGEMTYSGTTSSGISKTTIVSDQGRMTATTKMKGKRLGKCSGEEQTVSVDGHDVKELQEKGRQLQERAREGGAREEAKRQRSLKLINQIKIPKEKGDACEHVYNPYVSAYVKSDCDDRLPELAIRAGEWEVTTEITGKQVYGEMVSYLPVEVEKSKVCLSPFNEPESLRSEKMKRSGNTITWREATDEGIKMEFTGGVEYQGNSFEGGSIKRSGTDYFYTRVTGRRVGDGNCMGRDLTAKKIRKAKLSGESPRAAAGENGARGVVDQVLDNPVRKMRSIIGF
ncbi:MAG: hypothetical protein A2075_11830 [Geobacteraceae bacterium GWC2_58_44]|nr:MAG: hypothetical protein A2075_11830 [Geobacteraceae bacterium GWC2_58_44]